MVVVVKVTDIKRGQPRFAKGTNLHELISDSVIRLNLPGAETYQVSFLMTVF